jgi:hypothetical protein
MKKVVKIKGLSKLNTVVTKHIRARPPQHGTSYLDMYLLNMEKQRLEQEMAHLDERRGRIQERLAAARVDIMRLQEVAQREEANTMSNVVASEAVANQARSASRYAQSGWKTMPLEY